MGVLDEVAATPGTSIADVARWLPTTAQAISQVVNRLERLGFLERRLGARGHGVALFVTGSGDRARAEADQRVARLNEQLADALGQAHHDTLIALLDRARTALERSGPDVPDGRRRMVPNLFLNVALTFVYAVSMRQDDRKPMDHRGTTALITGASSGIGAELAERLAGRGADVVLVARSRQRLERAAAALTAEHGVRATAITADLSRPGAARELADELARRQIVPTTLVNNAGIGLTRAFADSDASVLADQVALNVTAVVELTRALLGGLVSAESGALVNVASLSAYQPLPQMAVYAASKAFVLHFTEALSAELAGTGVRVLAVSPGPTRSGFYDASGTTEDGVRFQEPADVATTVLGALDAARTPPSVVSGRRNAAQVSLARLLPRRTVLRLAARAVQPGGAGA